MPKQLLIEHSLFTPISVLKESRMGSKNLIVSGKMQACDEPNANQRIYPYNVLYPQIQKYIDGPVKENRALGELDHPETSIINLKNVSHNIKRLWWEGNSVFGDVEILPTPSGNILMQLFQSGISVGISSRAMGSTTPIGEGLVRVEEDLDFICWDFVSQPSTHGAFMRPESNYALKESVNLNRQETNKYQKVNQMMSGIICELSGVCCIN